MSTTVEALRATRAFIDTPDKWCKGALARRSDGDGTWPAAEDAISHCAVGAMYATRVAAGCGVYEALDRVIGLDGGYLSDWNNAPERTHAEVLAAFDRAIEVEQAREQEFTVEPGELVAA